mgnify:CR=1 FL=1
MAESMVGLKRTHRCTEVTTAHIGQEVTVMGWVQKSRNKGGIIFADLRDNTGILQLIFDDSTSAVDTATEGKIRHALAALTDVTKLIIAQRITSVMDADMIVILDDGKVHAVGTHKELLANDTIYQEIYASQMKGDDADGKGIQR